MAWTTPPTFTDGNVLSASQLNILSEDLSFLYGIMKAPQVAFNSLYANKDLTSLNNSFRIRYYHRYIHYRISVVLNVCNNVHLYVNGTNYTLDTTARSAGYVYTGYVDVVAQGLTEGTIYTCYFTSGLATQNTSAILIEDLIQAEGTTL